MVEGIRAHFLGNLTIMRGQSFLYATLFNQHDLAVGLGNESNHSGNSFSESEKLLEPRMPPGGEAQNLSY